MGKKGTNRLCTYRIIKRKVAKSDGQIANWVKKVPKNEPLEDQGAISNSKIEEDFERSVKMNKELEDDFTEALMVSLQEERVIERIKEIVEAGSFSQVGELKELLREKEKKIAKLQQEIQSKQEEISEYQIMIHQLNEKMEFYFNELQKRRADYREAEELYEAVQRLSENTKNSLKGIFKGSSVQEFIVCGVQYENISSLWDFIKNEIMEGREQERGILRALFQYFFQEYNKTYDTPLYKLQEVKINEVFRENLYIRALNSKISGNITDILLPGYMSINGKTIKKSVVRI
ncbi:hypothetical protein ACQKNS_25435 [Peribacillus sp. NPDC094092]|uniref:hypothetical protein n=1 Tax=Peribacillus sp. NPDC094092 TaxID=3390611 RepID=UPI003CFBD27E